MMPPFILESPKNQARANAIAKALLTRDYDILCLEKVFDCDAQTVLAKALAQRYPYQYGPANPASTFKLSSGVWVLSKFPLCNRHEIEFRDCAGVECLSRKGAIMLDGTFHGRRFQLIATHLEGEEGAQPTPKHTAVRARQMEQIKSELLDRYSESGVPVFLCGDFCTPRRDETDPLKDSAAYDGMVQLFGAENGAKDRITLNDNRWRNDLATDDSLRTDEMDYILVHSNGVRLHVNRDVVLFRSHDWDGPNGRQDLSYRYAVSASISFP